MHHGTRHLQCFLSFYLILVYKKAYFTYTVGMTTSTIKISKSMRGANPAGFGTNATALKCYVCGVRKSTKCMGIIHGRNSRMQGHKYICLNHRTPKGYAGCGCGG